MDNKSTNSDAVQSQVPSGAESVVAFVSSSAESPVVLNGVLIGPFAHVVNARVAYCETLENNHRQTKSSQHTTHFLLDLKYAIFDYKQELTETNYITASERAQTASRLSPADWIIAQWYTEPRDVISSVMIDFVTTEWLYWGKMIRNMIV